MSECDVCGKESRIIVTGAEKDAHFCLECHNKMLAELMDEDFPPDIPKRITLSDNKRNVHIFTIEFMLFPHCKSLKAYETGKFKYKCEIYGEPGENFFQMWHRLMERLERMMSVKYIMPNGRWNNDRVLGYIEYNGDRGAYEVIIDGKPHTWEELGRNLSAYDGFQVKIEIADPTDDFE